MGDIRSNKAQLYSAVVFLLLLVVAYVYLVKPIDDRMSDTKSELASKQQEYEAMTKAQSANAKMADEAKIKLEASGRSIPVQPEEEALIRDLRRMEVVSGIQLKQYNITVGSEAVTPAGSSSALSAFPVKIETSLVGSYSQIAKLLQEMESLDRLIQVSNVTLNANQNSLVQVNAVHEPIVGNLSLTAYYSPSLAGILKPNSVDYDEPAGRTTPFY